MSMSFTHYCLEIFQLQVYPVCILLINFIKNAVELNLSVQICLPNAIKSSNDDNIIYYLHAK